jgi:hypothetical protein
LLPDIDVQEVALCRLLHHHQPMIIVSDEVKGDPTNALEKEYQHYDH